MSCKRSSLAADVLLEPLHTLSNGTSAGVSRGSLQNPLTENRRRRRQTTTLTVSVPRPSIRASMVSPRTTGPTPEGVPDMMTSPA